MVYCWNWIVVAAENSCPFPRSFRWVLPSVRLSFTTFKPFLNHPKPFCTTTSSCCRGHSSPSHPKAFWRRSVRSFCFVRINKYCKRTCVSHCPHININTRYIHVRVCVCVFVCVCVCGVCLCLPKISKFCWKHTFQWKITSPGFETPCPKSEAKW